MFDLYGRILILDLASVSTAVYCQPRFYKAIQDFTMQQTAASFNLVCMAESEINTRIGYARLISPRFTVRTRTCRIAEAR